MYFFYFCNLGSCDGRLTVTGISCCMENVHCVNSIRDMRGRPVVEVVSHHPITQQAAYGWRIVKKLDAGVAGTDEWCQVGSVDGGSPGDGANRQQSQQQ